MIESYVLELERQLAAVGIRRRGAGRILAETREHLRDAAACVGEERAVGAFGPADALARRMAAERATVLARGAAFTAFGALAAAAVAVTGALALMPAAPDIFGGRVPGAGVLTTVLVTVAAQVSFVAGSLALVRAFRLRSIAAAPAAELALLRRRSAVGLGAGGLTLAGLSLYALDFQAELAGWWTWGTIMASVALVVPMGAAAWAGRRASRPAAAPGADAGDVFDDLRPVLSLSVLQPLELSRHPRRFALVCAGAVGLAVALAGWYAEGDPASGIMRGTFEASALLGCWMLLRRPLGLGAG